MFGTSFSATGRGRGGLFEPEEGRGAGHFSVRSPLDEGGSVRGLEVSEFC